MRWASLALENKLRGKGFQLIAGVDEVGRGPLAGPVVAAAVILSPTIKIKGLADSKILSAQKREMLFKIIKQRAVAIGIGQANRKKIDQLNIRQANLLAMKRAVENLGVTPDYILLDGPRDRLALNIPQAGIKGGDRKCAAIAAASIIAKVTRDRIMLKLHQKYPEYSFDRHKGYGTKEHVRRLMELGPCPIHRRSFAPVRRSSCRSVTGRARQLEPQPR